MRAVIGDQVVELADHRGHAALVLIEVAASARTVWPAPSEPSGQRTVESLRGHATLMRDRLIRLPAVLAHDGPMATLARTRTVLQRGRPPEIKVGCASFAGRVLEGDGWVPGTFVAGVSPTHLPDTELALVRPELLLQVPHGVSTEHASMVLHGSMAMYAVAAATRESRGPIGVLGHNAVAYLCASGLIAAGVPLALAPGQSPELSRLGIKAIDTPGPVADVWIDARAPAAAPVAVSPKLVLGVQQSTTKLVQRWPGAVRREAIDVDSLLTDRDLIIDLFYTDGPVDWPPWLGEEHRRRFLDLAATGLAATGHALTSTTIRGSDTPSDLSTTLEAARAGSGVMVTAFQRATLVPRKRLLVGSPPPRARHGISVVGLGDWARGDLLESLQHRDDVALRGLCDRRPEALHLARHTLSHEYATTHYEELLADPATDLIVVATYHGSHSELAIEALKAGKHCFIEKPPVVREDQLNALFDAAKRSDRFLYVGFNRRFATATQRLVGHLREASGPTMVDIVVHGIPLPQNHWYYWPSNGNRIISNACHFIDLALQLTLGERPTRIGACATNRGRADSQITLTMSFEAGSTASITYSNRGSDRGPAIYFQSYQVMKDDLTARIDDFQRLDVWRRGKRVDRWRGQLDLGHRRQMLVVADALARGGPSPVPLETAELTATVVLAAARAAAEQTEVDLPRPTP